MNMAALPPDKTEPFVPSPRRRWGPWATTAFGLAATALMGAAQTGGVFLFMLWWNGAHPDEPIRVQDLQSNGPALATAFAVSAPLIIGFIALAVKWSREDFNEYLGLRWPSAGDALIGAATIAGVLGLAGTFASLLEIETPAFAGDTYGSAAKAGFLPLYVVAFTVLAPVQEEILFRGFLYRGFAPSFGPLPAIVFLSAIWAVFHVQYEWFFIGEIFALGLAFGWLRWRSGSLPLTIGLHMAVNGLAMLAASLGD